MNNSTNNQTSNPDNLRLEYIINRFRENEVGDAKLLVRICESQSPIIYDHAEKVFYIFQNHFYVKDQTGQAHRIIDTKPLCTESA